MKPESDSATEPVTCLNCGHVGLPSYKGTFISCDAWLDPEKYYGSSAAQQKPPVLIVVFSALLGIGAIFSCMGTGFVMFMSAALADESQLYRTDSQQYTINSLVAVGLLFGLTILLGITPFNLYDMKKRGRYLALMTLVIGIALNGFVCISLFFNSVGSSSGLSPACGSIIGIPIQAYILRWLLHNGHRFR